MHAEVLWQDSQNFYLIILIVVLSRSIVSQIEFCSPTNSFQALPIL